MKKLFTFAVLGFIGLSMNAQKITEKTFDYGQQFIEADLKFASEIEVKTWDKKSIYFKASIYVEDPQFQDMHELKIDESNSTINITSDATALFEAYRKDCLKRYPNKKRYCYNNGDLTEFNYVLYVPKNAKFKVRSINGSLTSDTIEGEFTADLINGDININTYTGNLNLSTINGEIDLKMNNAKITAETIHGNIYADEKLKFTFTDRHVGQKISGQTAKGKNKLRLNTINGNMYLRL